MNEWYASVKCGDNSDLWSDNIAHDSSKPADYYGETWVQSHSVIETFINNHNSTGDDHHFSKSDKVK